MNLSKLFLAIYALLMIGGGYMGYAKAGSQVSLMAGLISGILIFIGLYSAKKRPTVGYGLTASVSGLLIISFTMRFMKTGSFIPSGMLAILSLVAMLVSILALRKSN